MIDPDLVVTERAALVASWLLAGERLTVQIVADRLSIGYPGAWRLLRKVAGVLCDCVEAGGFWFIQEAESGLTD
jgi:hypothetical protein